MTGTRLIATTTRPQDQLTLSGIVPEGGANGNLFDTSQWSDFVDAVNARHDAGLNLRHAFIVTSSQAEYQQIVGKLDPSLATAWL